DIDEPRPRAGLHDRSRGSDEGHRHGNDVVAGADAECEEGDAECVGSVRDADDPLHVQEFGEFTFEAFELVAADIGGTAMDQIQLERDTLADFKVLSGQIHEFYFHCDCLFFNAVTGPRRRAGWPATIAAAGTS